MAKVTSINYDRLVRKLESSRGVNAVITKRIQEAIAVPKSQMLDSFDTHPVTREIKAGPSGGNKNISGTLNGYGNLYSFIGFVGGQDPTEFVRNFLKENSGLSKSRIKTIKINKKSYVRRYPYEFPDTDILYALTPLVWEPGRSWVEGIEEGISGFGYYLNFLRQKASSRSGYGLQNKTTIIRTGDFRTTPYLSKILDDFQGNIERAILKGPITVKGTRI